MDPVTLPGAGCRDTGSAVTAATSPGTGPFPKHDTRGRGAIRLAGLAALACLAAAEVPHPFRLSVADAGMEGPVLHASIRFFWDDLQLAVMEHTADTTFRLAETPEVDAIIERYINEMLVLTAGETVLPGKVTASGIDEADIIDEVMWWYRVEYGVEESVERVHVRNRLLFNVFEDQRNLVHLKTRRGRERAWSFTVGNDNGTMRLN